jgi:glycine betaine/proline transport system ATP-binding protein/glycine betaine/proline transport system permease protein
MDNSLMFPLELIDITKRYRSRPGEPALALDHVSLALPAGQILGLLGHSSAGKTTLLRIAAGSLQPTHGEVRVYGEPANHSSQRGLREALPGLRRLDPRRSLLESLHAAEDPHPEWTTRLLQVLSLQSRMEDRISTLPQTLQNRSALAGVLLSGAEVILLDEQPFMDPQTVQLLQDWLPDWVHELDKTVLIATRQPALALSLADRLAILRQGRLVFDGSPSDLEGAQEKISVRLRVAGRLDGARCAWFQWLSIAINGADTLIYGDIEDDAALYGLIAALRGLGLPLLSLERLNLGIEQHLQRLMD